MAIKAGGEVDAWCTKCRMDLSHRVVAMIASGPKRVECQTCHSQHNYRAPKTVSATAKAPKSAAAKPRKAASTSKKAVSPKRVNEWERLVAGQGVGAFRAYSISARFEPTELIRHSKFGDGCVLEVLEDNKIHVVFRDGPKVLIHART